MAIVSGALGQYL